jgi:hypothetical protein
MMQVFVVVSCDVAPRKHIFQMLREFGVNRHHVFEVPVLGAILHHQDLAVALDDLGLDLPDFLVHQNFVWQVPIQNLLPDFRHALGAKRIRCTRPAERGLGLFVRFEQRLVRPLGSRRRVGVDAVQAIEHNPGALGGGDNGFLDVLNRLAHDNFGS